MSYVGKKFIIEIDKMYLDYNGNKLYKVKGFNSLVFDEHGLQKLTAYSDMSHNIEMDPEETLSHAYARGWNDGTNKAFETLNATIKDMLSRSNDS